MTDDTGQRPLPYPAILDLRGRRTLVVGGGAVAERKARRLVESGARVVLVSPTATEALAALAEAETIEWVRRGFEKDDVRGAWLAFAATNDPETNDRVCGSAEAAGVFANRAEAPDRGTLTIPATRRRGRLTVAVSTDGASPALAARLAEGFAGSLPDETAALVEWLDEARKTVRRRVGEADARRRILSALSDDEEVSDRLSAGDIAGADARLEALLCEAADGGGNKG